MAAKAPASAVAGARHRRTPDLLCRNHTLTYPWSVAVLDTANVPGPSIPEAFAPDIASRPVIDDGIVVVGPRCCEGSAKKCYCIKAADDGSDGKPMLQYVVT